MSYRRFAAMIATSTVVMFILMYLNTFAWEHLWTAPAMQGVFFCAVTS